MVNIVNYFVILHLNFIFSNLEQLMITLEQPLGRIFTSIGKSYLHLLRKKLIHLDIDRYYYALLLIESGSGEITQQELSELLDSDKVSVVRIINYFTEKGYVIRKKLEGDQRKHCLLLTQKAMNVVPEIKEAIEQLNKIALNIMDVNQIQEFNGVLEKIKSNINSSTISQ